MIEDIYQSTKNNEHYMYSTDYKKIFIDSYNNITSS